MRKAINFKGKQGFLFGCKQQSRELLRDMSGFRTASEKVPTMKSQGSAKNEANNVAQTAAAAPAETAKVDFSNVKVEPLFEEEVDFDTFSKSDFRAVKVKECVAVPKSKKLLQFTLDDGTGTDRTILSGIHAYYEPEELVGKTLIAITNLPPEGVKILVSMESKSF